MAQIDGCPVASRKELHGSISPAVYSEHAREVLISDIDALPFPNLLTIDPLDIANSSTVIKALGIERSEALHLAQAAGVLHAVDGSNFSVFHYGYGDRHFTPLFAGGIGREINDLLQRDGLTTEPLSLMDYAKMFQTGWFGDIANQMALTNQGQFQPYFKDAQSAREGSRYSTPPHRSGWGVLQAQFEVPAGQSYRYEVEPDSGLRIIKLTHEARKALHGKIDRKNSVGCPVARTAFKTTLEQADFLHEYGHVGESSGFYPSQDLSEQADGVIFYQGCYTAIDDVLWQWGDYLQRYAEHLMSKPLTRIDVIGETGANKVLLLD